VVTDPAPAGFAVAVDDRRCVVRYRTTGMRTLGCFAAVWLGVWAIGVGLSSYRVVVDGRGDAGFLLWLGFAWGVEVVSIALVLWYFRAVTEFRFEPARLVVEQSLWRLRRLRVIPAADVRAVEQVKDGVEGDDSFPSWGLVLVLAAGRVTLLAWQPADKSAWLGPVVARWAGVSYVPAAVRP